MAKRGCDPHAGSLLHRVADTNRQTVANWDVFADHRAHLTRIIRALCGEGVDRLAILGAGNCNDIELRTLLEQARIIDLVDLDSEAVKAGLEKQRLGRCRRIKPRVGIDVTGAAHCLSWSNKVPTDNQINRYEKKLRVLPRFGIAGGYDLVISVCLLSQLISALVDVLGPNHPRLIELVKTLRDQHLRLLVTLLRKGGRGLLVSDFVSSDSSPDLLDASDGAVQSLALAALKERNFFTGTNPLVVSKRLRTVAPKALDEVRLLRPWKWRISEKRAYLVYALKFRRRV
jgi:hypothetical protein